MPSTTGNIGGLPEEYKQCVKELAEWFVGRRRKIRLTEMRAIAQKYFTTDEELTKFYQYLESPEGSTEFGKIIRMEAWKAGISGPAR